MSFTSQNFGVGKYKRMDRVLIDCMILSVGAALVLGCGAYFFGAEILQIYTEEADVIQCGVEILSITTVPYFLCGIMDLFRVHCVEWDIPQCQWYCLLSEPLECVYCGFLHFSTAQITVFSVYFLSGIVDCNNRNAGGMLLFCKKALL